MPAVLLQDIILSISSPTVVMKMDIEGYECKVHLCDILLLFLTFLQALQTSILFGKSGKFIPVIFMEWDKVVR